MMERRKWRRLWALGIWGMGLLLLALQTSWGMASIRRDVESRLISEAGRAAAQVAGLLCLPAWERDELAVRTVIMSVMEDARIYGIMVQTRQGFFDGMRRNYQWEPVPWDDEITEHAVQGMSQLSMEGEFIGKVEVYLSRRDAVAEIRAGCNREIRQGLLWFVYLTAALLCLLGYWGDLGRLRQALRARWQRLRGEEAPARGDEPGAPVEPGGQHAIRLGLSPAAGEADPAARTPEAATPEEEGPVIISPELGRGYQRSHPESWRITAGLFRQSFERGPLVLTRLYEDNEPAAICHLGRMLERAAPCLGAERLAQAARDMQTALNDPQCETQATAVENCSAALRDVLTALNTPQTTK
ncbi:MAG TPA: hypothetical protein H9784_05695 [Candidatus Desulfovibrio intestinavium]|uniref:Uncharacterized protein n=1 Tax=Candidatus Desulfovibrio intestinavium TaxID=2838534 RepID=A0A9D2HMQ0_9BACT|nr:hypothetical protein [Candidatus Desulfovibrio intestinavium]